MQWAGAMSRKVNWLGVRLAGAAVFVLSCLQPSWAYPKRVMIGEPLGSDAISRSIASMAPSMSDQDLSQKLMEQYRTAVSKTDWGRVFDTDHIECVPLPPSEDFCSTIYFEDFKTENPFLTQTKRTTWLVSISAARHGDNHQILAIQVKRNADFPPAADVAQQKGSRGVNNFLDRLTTMAAGDSFGHDAVGRALGTRSPNLGSVTPYSDYVLESLKGRLSSTDVDGLAANPGQCLMIDKAKSACSLLYYYDQKPDLILSRLFRYLMLVTICFEHRTDYSTIISLKVNAAGGLVQ